MPDKGREHIATASRAPGEATTPAMPASVPPPVPAARGDGRIEAANLYKWFPGGIVLEDVSLTVSSGEFLCIVGPSGCGKTTLLRLVAGLTEAGHGTLSVGGIPVTGPSPKVAVVFQHFGLFPWKTVYRNVALPLQLARVGKAETEQRVREVLATVGLTGHERKYPAQLSGGMKQRAAPDQEYWRRGPGPPLLLPRSRPCHGGSAAVSADVICLRPEADFLEVGVHPPADLAITYAEPAQVRPEDLATARAVVLASVGPRLERSWLDKVPNLELVQFTGAGVDRVGDAVAHRPVVTATDRVLFTPHIAGVACEAAQALTQAWDNVHRALKSGGGCR